MLLYFYVHGICFKSEIIDKCQKHRIMLYLLGKLAKIGPVSIDNSAVEPYLARPIDDKCPTELRVDYDLGRRIPQN